MTLKNLLLFLLASLLLAACGEPSSQLNRKKVAVIAPMTGGAAIYGEWISRGIALAQKGEAAKLEFNYLDSGADPKVAVTLAQKALADKSLIAVWTVTSADTMAIRDLVTTAGVTLITSSATSPSITDGRSNVFRSIVNSAQETNALVRFAKSELKPTKAAILYINDAGGQASLGQFKGFLGDAGVSIALTEPFEKAPQDLRNLALKTTASGADIIVVTGYSGAMGLLLKAIREIDPNIPIVCNQGLETPENLALPPQVLHNVHYSIATIENTSAFAEFKKAYNSTYQKDPGLYEVTAYDTAKILAQATGGPDANAEALPSKLRSINYEGANGRYSFTKWGNVVKHVSVKSFKSGVVTVNGPFNVDSN